MALRRRKREADADEAVIADDQAQAPERGRLTPVDIQQKVFRLAFRGYNERDVDEFLDEVTESLAALHEENKRLLEQLQDAGSGGSPGALAVARQQAEAIVRDARERAEGISGGAAPAASSVPSSFLVRERAFLQRIALLVQEHAGSLKDEARRAREAPARATSPESTTAGVESEEAPGPTAVAEPPGDETAPGDESGDENGARDEEPGTSRPEAAAAGAGAALAVEAGAAPRSVSIPEAGSAEPAEFEEAPGDAPDATIEPIRARDGGEPGDATAPWRPVETQASPPAGGPSDDDPLVSAWESAFLDKEEESGQPSEARVSRPGRRPSDKDEPSLRELFWGEE